MPKVVSQQELDRIETLIAQHPEGVGVDALWALAPDISRRTLQRRLAVLVEKRRIRPERKGRALRYRHLDVVDVSVHERIATNDQAAAEIYVG